MDRLQSRLASLDSNLLSSLTHGIEKESLRVLADGALSDASHPAALGSALTHPRITTDFSESQLEMVTGVHGSIDACLAELQQVHQLVYRGIEDEFLWSTSMPCRLPADDEIPIGQYGHSNIGRLKTVYRTGLAHRYGRRMQTISGVHYNFSLPDGAWPCLQQADGDQQSLRDYRDQSYFALIRNFRRHSWLLLYLFGASPAVCGSFVAGRSHQLQPIGKGSMYLPYGTSMRMGPLGYQSDAQKSLAVSFNNLQGYGETLHRGLTQTYPPYTDIGICDGREYRQLNTTLLQIENEFYGTIRPKRRINPGERPLHALGERGVEYVEVRCLDIDPFDANGVSADTAHMIDIFLLHCLLTDSPMDSPASIEIDAANQLKSAQRGRDPSLTLCHTDKREISLSDWGLELLNECAPIAQALDQATNSAAHRQALQTASARLQDPSLTPSAQVLSQMATLWDNSYQAFALAQSQKHRNTVTAQSLDEQVWREHQASARESIADQQNIEAADTIDFESYRREYFKQDLDCCERRSDK